MEVNELRIGNYINQVKYRNGDCNVIRKVASVNKEGFLNVDVLGEHTIRSLQIIFFEPIPLTEEWLLKFGFIKYRHILKIHLNEGLGVNYNKDLKIWYLDIHFTTTAKIQINYIHQLQNLYFALTGEELSIK